MQRREGQQSGVESSVFPPLEFARGGRRPNGFLGMSVNDRTFLFLVIFLDKTASASVG